MFWRCGVKLLRVNLYLLYQYVKLYSHYGSQQNIYWERYHKLKHSISKVKGFSEPKLCNSLLHSNGKSLLHVNGEAFQLACHGSAHLEERETSVQ